MSDDRARPGEHEVRLKRIARPAYVVGAAILVALMVAAAFVAGMSIERPAASSDAAAAAAPAVTAQVEMRVVQEGLQVPGKVSAPESLDVKLADDGVLGSPAAGDGEGSAESEAGAVAGAEQTAEGAEGPMTDRNVITRMVAAEGDQLAAGDLLAEVSGRPVVAAPPGTPLYRDFELGLAGQDVLAIQQLLSDLGYMVDLDGILDADTMDTIMYWYAQLGYELPQGASGQRRLPWRELLPLPPGALTVVAPGTTGSVLSGDSPLLTVRRGAPVIEAIVDAGQVARFREAKSVFVGFEGKNIEAAVVSIGEMKTDDDTGVSGHTVTVACPSEIAERASEITTVSISTEKPEEASFAVPLTAIEEDDHSQFVILDDTKAERTGGTGTPGERVDVEVIVVSGGWAAIAENARLPEGARIRVG
ncbi:hypothetical protein [Leucobacter triazinivorans]|uniref:Peptidoglycan-binding protein n=1 Tax=Leucobacter triazinivorans TaxID=1784719 RepID=A0A4P6KHG3_9MICO|nr:hypothetical protein [Leucobacter triazinivorans]QBE49521.1 hypothetical protein EVS81_12325 [Leucobacter triazinivorans]